MKGMVGAPAVARVSTCGGPGNRAAQAAQESTAKVIKMVDDDEVAGLLRRMRQEAAETEKRCRAVAGERKGKKSAIQEKAKETKSERHVKDIRAGSLKLAAQEDPNETE